MIYIIEKEIGFTMNELLEQAKLLYKTDKITYAGRLDPLAYGQVIMLTDEDIYKRDKYTCLDKIYEFNLIEGIQTDSFDILGKITNNININQEIIPGKYIMEYPPYSSYYIKEHKKRYWECAKLNLEVKNKPTKEIIIYNIEKTDNYTKTKSEILEIITDRILKIKNINNEFRQKEILERWETIEDKIYTISKYTIKISSGGYVRTIGNKLNGCCFDIYRKKYCF